MATYPLVQQWLTKLSTSSSHVTNDEPHYWHSNPQTLISPSTLHNLSLGTGSSIYTTSILPLISTASQEIILVTCFWAGSATLSALNSTLCNLSAKGQQSGRRIRVRIYFSSSSLAQKLFHPQTLQGRSWEPSKLGLPLQEEVPGLDVKVKSVFLLPFSVMHPKFVIVDRARVLLPSCNVSWEDWFEGCVELSGGVVEQFVRFWRDFWATDEDAQTELKGAEIDTGDFGALSKDGSNSLSSRDLHLNDIQTLFLPSPHHRNPRFAFFPWQTCPPPPPTPLNVFLLAAIKGTQRSIYIQTPNLTATPVLSALLTALRRGVSVTVLTSEKLMILEQLVTAGTTTARCTRKLVKRYKRLSKGHPPSFDSPSLLESGDRPLGHLAIGYYQPLPPHAGDMAACEPVQSHLKLTIIDEEWTILGSGNLDRASLFTSQELGVAFCSKAFAEVVSGDVSRLMEGRKRIVFESGSGD